MQAIGFAPYRYRLTLYVIAGTLCGLAGFLLGNQAEFVSPAYMHWQRSGELILMLLLGGTGTLYGPIVGAVAYLALEEALSRLTEHWKVILGPSLILLVLFAEGGVAGAIDAYRRGHFTRRPPRALLRDGLAAGAAWRARSRDAIAALRPRLDPLLCRFARQPPRALLRQGLASGAALLAHCRDAIGVKVTVARSRIALLFASDRWRRK